MKRDYKVNKIENERYDIIDIHEIKENKSCLQPNILEYTLRDRNGVIYKSIISEVIPTTFLEIYDKICVVNGIISESTKRIVINDFIL